MKVKYTWELMHGDADHYDKESLTLTNENDIIFFDYVINLEFQRRNCKGLIYNQEEKERLIELIRNTQYVKEWQEEITNLNEEFEEIIYEMLSNWNYIVSDCTCDGWHYASIENIERKEIKDKQNKDKKVYVVYTNELRCDIVKIFKNKNKARKFMEEGNGKYLELIDEYDLE